MDRADVLIIMDGGLPGVIACAMECERGLDVVAWTAPAGSPLSTLDAIDPTLPTRLVRRQAELYGAAEVVAADPNAAPSDALLHALLHARRRGAARVVWPHACGEDIDEMFRTTERASLVARLAALDPQNTHTRVETPFVDLTHDQLLALARDLEIAPDVWTQPPPVGAGGSGGAARA